MSLYSFYSASTVFKIHRVLSTLIILCSMYCFKHSFNMSALQQCWRGVLITTARPFATKWKGSDESCQLRRRGTPNSLSSMSSAILNSKSFSAQTNVQPQLYRSYQLCSFLRPFVLTSKQIKSVYKAFCYQIRQGLDKQTNSQAEIKCWITYVQDLPNGDERGKFLALDLGGTNFRVLLVTLQGKGKDTVSTETYQLPQHIVVGKGNNLFDHIADCLAKFTKKYQICDKRCPLGFTFSFPCIQYGLQKAKLIKWTKGFQASDVEGKDVVRLLKEAILRRGGAQIDVIAILNDTVGTLMSCAHKNPECRIGVIIGTGCNACYVERVQNVGLLLKQYRNKPNVIINCEWGAFGDRGSLECIRTKYDRIIDAKSTNKGHQLFEKMIAGMYLGELVQLVLSDAVGHNLIFSTLNSKCLLMQHLENTENCIRTSHLSKIEGDNPKDLHYTKHFIREVLDVNKPTEDDCKKIRLITEIVCRRAATLAGIGLSGLTNRVDKCKVVIGVDGSVYKYHPKFHCYIKETMKKFVNPGIDFELVLSEDGSGRGAALVTAVAAKDKN